MPMNGDEFRPKHVLEMLGSLPSRPPPGLGDRLAAIIHALHLDRLTPLFERVTGRPCRCDARRLWLNHIGASLRRFFD